MDAAPSQDGYYIVEQGQKKGPLDLSVLETMRRDGGLSETTLMWRDGMADWQPARTVVPEIFSGGTVTYSIAEPGQRVLAGVIDICIVQARLSYSSLSLLLAFSSLAFLSLMPSMAA